MKEELIEKQKRALLEHMKDYQNASQLSKKAQAIIFNKHKLPDGGYGPGLHDELKQARIGFAKEWGMNGWRNEHFVKNMINEAQRPTETQVEEMHRQYRENEDIGQRAGASGQEEERSPEAQEFLNQLDENNQKQKNKLRPGMG